MGTQKSTSKVSSHRLNTHNPTPTWNGIFHLLDGDKKLPTEKVPDGIDPTEWNSQENDEYKKALGALTRVWGIFPGESGQITYQFAVNALNYARLGINGVK